MEHVRLFLLMIGTLLAGYLCLCLVAPPRLEFSWEAPCRSGKWPVSDTVHFPWWEMERMVDASDSNSMVLRGRWGVHRINATEAADEKGNCTLRLSWGSTQWPFLLRGAAAMAKVPVAARHMAMEWYPERNQEQVD